MATIGLSKPYFAVYSAAGSTVSYANGAVENMTFVRITPRHL